MSIYGIFIKLINKIKSRLPVDSYSTSAVSWGAYNRWTCPKTGIVTLYIEPSTQSAHYAYIKDETDGIEGWLTNNRKETTSHPANYALIRPVSTGGNVNMGINLYVVGKWKNPTGGGIAAKLYSLLDVLSSRVKGVTV